MNISGLMQKRNQLAGYCKLIIYGVLELRAATDILKYYNKVCLSLCACCIFCAWLFYAAVLLFSITGSMVTSSKRPSAKPRPSVQWKVQGLCVCVCSRFVRDIIVCGNDDEDTRIQKCVCVCSSSLGWIRTVVMRS